MVSSQNPYTPELQNRALLGNGVPADVFIKTRLDMLEWALINWCPYEKATQHRNKRVTYRKSLVETSRNCGDAVTIDGIPGSTKNGGIKKTLLEPCSVTFTRKMFTTVCSLQRSQTKELIPHV